MGWTVTADLPAWFWYGSDIGFVPMACLLYLSGGVGAVLAVFLIMWKRPTDLEGEPLPIVAAVLVLVLIAWPLLMNRLWEESRDRLKRR